MLEISEHAVKRCQERIEDCSHEQARLIVLEIVERGVEARETDWKCFRTVPIAMRRYYVYRGFMAVVDTETDRIVTVLANRISSSARRPDVRSLRGLSVREALAIYQVRK